MPNHTPGPWRLTQAWSSLEFSKEFGVEAPTPEGLGFPTASATGYYAMALPPPHGRDAQSRVIQEANARLIAAAPDLLATLQEIAISGGEDAPGGAHIILSAAGHLECRRIARAAIAKAVGA